MSSIAVWEPVRAGKEIEERRTDCIVIDVRTPAEFNACHAVCAESIPLDTLKGETLKALVERAAGKKLFVLCHSGARARKAAEVLAGAGRADSIVVEGGTLAWKSCGLPVNEGAGGLSIERQVKIVAGTLAAAGALLSLLVHPSFAGLPLAIGCGLVYTGVTDSCAMGMLLGRMPWNKG
ncbi:MAG: DUF2892 domain-containing protein [Candidatus Hydrogenedens sp.]|nr:DUF2892 domain-containing protein [Candidatus Hydrogenedens sp.]